MTAPPDGARREGRRVQLAVGLSLASAAAAVAGVVTGPRGAVAALGFGLIATVIQVVAGRLMAGSDHRSIREFMQRWGLGMGLRMLGVLLVGLVALVDHPKVPPIPAALAYVGVLIPLLFLEARRFG